MGSLIRRAAVAAGATALVVGASAGAAAASTGALATLAFTPSGHNFGPVTVGQHANKGFTLTNNSSTATSPLTVSLAGPAGFTITADTCAGIRLGPGKTCTVTVRFAPSAAGAVTGTLKAAGISRAATASLTGTGTGHLYWSNYASGTINRANLDGTGATTLVTGQNYPVALAVDASHLYWVNYFGGNTVNEANLDGTGATTLVSGQNYAVGVAVDASHLYWAFAIDPSGDPNSGTINEIPLAGGTATTLVTGQKDPDAVAVDGSRLYWANLGAGTIDEANLNGGGVTTLVSGQSGPQGLAVSPS